MPFFSKNKREEPTDDAGFFSLDRIKAEVFQKLRSYADSLSCTLTTSIEADKIELTLDGFADVSLYDLLIDLVKEYMLDAMVAHKYIEYMFVIEWFPKGKGYGFEIQVDAENSNFSKDFVYVRNQENFLDLERLFPGAYCIDTHGHHWTNWRIPITSMADEKNVMKTLAECMRDRNCDPSKTSVSLRFTDEILSR